MRKSTAGILAVGSAFALTAAAASAIAVTGPFDPAAGTGPATSCDIGDTTVDSVTDGVSLTGFVITTGNNTKVTFDGAGVPTANAECVGVHAYVRVDYRDLTGTPDAITGEYPVESIYTDFLPDYDDYSANPLEANFKDGDVSGSWSTNLDFSDDVDPLALEDEELIRVVVLVSPDEPTNFVAEENL